MSRQRLLSRAAIFGLAWALSAALVAALEVSIDPLTAWEHLLEVLFGLMIPWQALVITLVLYRQLASPSHPIALTARHGANRRRMLAPTLAGSVGLGMALTCVALVLGRHICHEANQSFVNRDLVLCCGIGCLATGAYIAYLLAATRLGFGRIGAWVALGMDLTLGHVNAAWSIFAPHRHIVNLIGHPGFFALPARASSWILLGFMALGVAFAVARTPR